jgi:hypothetical protein
MVAFEQARTARQQASDAHNRQEIPNFAKSMEQRALSRQEQSNNNHNNILLYID